MLNRPLIFSKTIVHVRTVLNKKAKIYTVKVEDENQKFAFEDFLFLEFCCELGRHIA